MALVFPIGFGYWRADVAFFCCLMLNYIGFGLGASGTHGFLEKKKKERKKQTTQRKSIHHNIFSSNYHNNFGISWQLQNDNCTFIVKQTAVTAETTMKMKFQFASNVFLNDL